MANLLGWIFKNLDSIELAIVECIQRKNCVKLPPICLTEPQLQLLATVFLILNSISKATTILSTKLSENISLVFP